MQSFTVGSYVSGLVPMMSLDEPSVHHIRLEGVVTEERRIITIGMYGFWVVKVKFFTDYGEFETYITEDKLTGIPMRSNLFGPKSGDIIELKYGSGIDDKFLLITVKVYEDAKTVSIIKVEFTERHEPFGSITYISHDPNGNISTVTIKEVIYQVDIKAPIWYYFSLK